MGEREKVCVCLRNEVLSIIFLIPVSGRKEDKLVASQPWLHHMGPLTFKFPLAREREREGRAGDWAVGSRGWLGGTEILKSVTSSPCCGMFNSPSHLAHSPKHPCSEFIGQGSRTPAKGGGF